MCSPIFVLESGWVGGVGEEPVQVKWVHMLHSPNSAYLILFLTLSNIGCPLRSIVLTDRLRMLFPQLQTHVRACTPAHAHECTHTQKHARTQERAHARTTGAMTRSSCVEHRWHHQSTSRIVHQLHTL